ncbi:fungal-specific transcription factor domain-containing protein [Ustulina deusta]|nr:fungal-specific transcription factor domain-containing protein [Ustulina deusta]
MSAVSSNPRTKSKRGCWTCKARKVKCDQGAPTCQRCASAQRECEGYGLRLSWPRDNDRRRAIRANLLTTSTRTQMRYRDGNLLINTTSHDIELYRYLSLPGAAKPPSSALPSPKLSRNPQLEVTHMELLHYFREAAHSSLATFSPATAHLRDVIIQMIFTHDTVSRRALFYALLAFSSLHRGGIHRQTMLFKVTALTALSASAKEAAQGSVEAAQHVAACMILCAFEILVPSENSGEWLWYIRGATEIVQRARLGNQSNGNIDYGDLLDWVYFHDSMSRFTLYHWGHKYLAAKVTDTAINHVHGISQSSPLVEERAASLFQNRPHAILDVLSEICEVLLDPSDPRSQEIEYKDRLRALEWKVDNLPFIPSISVLDDPTDDVEFTAQLYRISTRVYLARASQDPLKPPADLNSLTDNAFAGPVQHCYCRHFFPLLIIAGEARTDEQRAAILNLIDRTEKHGYVRSMKLFRAQVQSFWIQQDLHADSEPILNYLSLMKAIVSSDRALPSYV